MYRYHRPRLPTSVAGRAALAAAVLAVLVIGPGLNSWRYNLIYLRDGILQGQCYGAVRTVVAALDVGGLPGLRRMRTTGVNYELLDTSDTVLASSESVRQWEHDGRALSVDPPSVPRPVVETSRYVRIVDIGSADSPLNGVPVMMLDQPLDSLGPGVTVPEFGAVGQPRYRIRVFVGQSSLLDPTTLVNLPMLGQAPWVMVVVFAAVVWVVSQVSLLPVRRMAAQAARITGGRLHHRLPKPRGRDPVARLAVTVNQMLDRLEQADEQQRRFVADAAHELRSPLAGLRTMLEVALAHPDPARLPAVLADAAAETERLTRLSEDLLLLARMDARQPLPEGVVDLAEVARQRVDRRAGARVPVTLDAPGPALVTGAEGQLGRVVDNLVDNAVRYAASRVTVSVHGADGQVRLVVADDGPGIPAADRERVFTRFVRLNEARDRDSGGTGLGLAIVRDVVERHGGRVVVADTPRGARLAVELPACPAGDDEP
jgi:signal transduction histidine kinase